MGNGCYPTTSSGLLLCIYCSMSSHGVFCDLVNTVTRHNCNCCDKTQLQTQPHRHYWNCCRTSSKSKSPQNIFYTVCHLKDSRWNKVLSKFPKADDKCEYWLEEKRDNMCAGKCFHANYGFTFKQWVVSHNYKLKVSFSSILRLQEQEKLLEKNCNFLKISLLSLGCLSSQ